MRVFSSTVQNILNQDVINFFVLIKLSFNSTYYLASAPYDIPFNGDTYLANSGILEYDSPKFSSVVDREAYKIIVTDFYDEMVSEIEDNVVGKAVEVRIGFYDANNQPIVNQGDVLLAYKGYVDTPTISNNFEQKLVSFEGTSPMADLDIIRPFMASKDGMDQIDPNWDNPLLDDTSFDQIYGDSFIRLKWGKS